MIYTANEIKAELAHCTGGDGYTRHWLSRRFLYTDGIAHMAEICEAHWLIDAIFSHQRRCLRDRMLWDIQFWTFEVGSFQGHKGRLRCWRDTNDRFLTQRILFTDFPLDSIKLILERGGDDWILMLPSER